MVCDDYKISWNGGGVLPYTLCVGYFVVPHGLD